MEENSLYNPGFLGAGGFHWWVGQIMDDAKWRENIADKKFEGTSEIPGWGYRYKVRIIGLHDREEATVPSDQLPWAQVMYPITSGGGQAGARQTPNLRQGNFVFGFFLDGAEQEVPVIMGVLGNNAQTKLLKETSTDKANYAGVSGYSKGEKPDPALKVADEYILTDNKTFKEDSTAVHLLQTSDVKRNDLYTSFTVPLASPCKKQNSQMSNIQTTIKNLTYEINKIQQEFLSPIDAAARSNKKVAEVITKATNAISGYMKTIMDRVRSFVIKQYNKVVSPTVDKIFPNSRHKLLELKEKANLKLVCLFNKVIGNLPKLIGAFLNNSYGKYKDKPTKESDLIVPPKKDKPSVGIGTTVVNPLDIENYISGETNEDAGPRPIPGYEERPPSRRPVPICSVEELVGNILGNTLPEITQGIDQAIDPINTFLVDYFSEISQIPGGINVVAASGALNTQASSLNPFVDLAVDTQINTSTTSSVTIDRTSSVNQVTNTGSSASVSDVANSIMTSIQNGQNVLGQASDIYAGLQNGDILGAAGAVGGQVGQIAGQVGGVVGALQNGDLLGAAGAVGGQVGQIAGQISQYLGKGTSIIGSLIGNVTSALGFINSILNFFKCDDEPQCPQALGYRLHDGSVGTAQADKPNLTNIAKTAETAEKVGDALTAQPFATPTQNTDRTRNVKADGTSVQQGPYTVSVRTT